MNNRMLPNQFLDDLRQLEKIYLAQSDPIRQSGFYGGEKRWQTERKIIINALDKDGDFLDIGCANGYLLKCLVSWATEQNLKIDPYGIDIGPGLIGLAKDRFPDIRDHFWVADAWEWAPPRKFDYVYALADNVPPAFLSDYLLRLLRQYVSPEGLLIIGAYGSTSKNQPAQNAANALIEAGLRVDGQACCGELPVTHIAWTRNSDE